MQKYFGLALDTGGVPVDSAQVFVYGYGTGSLATLYADDESTTKPNPLTTDSEGRYEFNAVNGRYTIQVKKNGVVRSFDKVQLQDSGTVSGVETIQKTVVQPGHGFVVGNVVRFNGTQYIKALADTATNAESQGIVISVGGSSFTIVIAGTVSGLSGLTPDTVYFLSPTSAGALTASDPALSGTFGQISKPILYAITSTSGIVYQQRGFKVTNGAFDAAAVGYSPELPGLWSAPLPSLMSTAIDQLIKLVNPIGEPRFTLDALPTGPYTWLDGSVVLKVSFYSLWLKWGTRFNTVAVTDPDNYFQLPDLRGLTPIGADNFGTSQGAAGRLAFAGASTPGTVYGEEKHTMTLTELVPHTHTVPISNVNDTSVNAAEGQSSTASNLQSSSTGGGTPFNVVQPSIVGRWYCRY